MARCTAACGIFMLFALPSITSGRSVMHMHSVVVRYETKLIGNYINISIYTSCAAARSKCVSGASNVRPSPLPDHHPSPASSPLIRSSQQFGNLYHFHLGFHHPRPPLSPLGPPLVRSSQHEAGLFHARAALCVPVPSLGTSSLLPIFRSL